LSRSIRRCFGIACTESEGAAIRSDGRPATTGGFDFVEQGIVVGASELLIGATAAIRGGEGRFAIEFVHSTIGRSLADHWLCPDAPAADRGETRAVTVGDEFIGL